MVSVPSAGLEVLQSGIRRMSGRAAGVSVPSAGLEVLQFFILIEITTRMMVSVPSAGLEVLQYADHGSPLQSGWRFSTLCGFGSPSITLAIIVEVNNLEFQYPLRVWKSFNFIATIYGFSSFSFSTLCGFGSPSMPTIAYNSGYSLWFQYPLRVWKSFNQSETFGGPGAGRVSVPSAGLEVLQST